MTEDHDAQAVEPSSAWAYFNNTLRRPKTVVAPMVEQSELAWRLLSRAHNSDLCYTPMIHASVFERDPTYRTDYCQPHNDDKPLIAQFCANDPETFVKSVNIIAPFCDGVDLNLGCPQTIAKRGNYGAFLQDEWEKIHQLVYSVHKQCSVPISVKIRVFDDIEKTLKYAKMIEGSGAQILAVHGRTREQKGLVSGLADWDKIRAVKQAMRIPVIANGNIAVNADVVKCFEQTGVDAVMSAGLTEGNLHNPYIFEADAHPCHWTVAREYLDIVKKLPYPTSMSCIRAHVFKLLHHSLLLYPDIRSKLAVCSSLADVDHVIHLMQQKCLPLHEQYTNDPSSVQIGSLMMPHWLCQPYFRDTSVSPDPALTTVVREEFRTRNNAALDSLSDATGWSKTRLRRLRRHNNDLDALRKNMPAAKSLVHKLEAQRIASRKTYSMCDCFNPIGGKCVNKKCRACCRNTCVEQQISCQGHKFWFGDKSVLLDRLERKRLERENAANEHIDADTTNTVPDP